MAREERQQYVRLCDCGCGQPTLLVIETNRPLGWVKGEPLRRLHGHSGFGYTKPEYVVNETTGCWEWQRSLDRKGYGVRAVGKLNKRAHRVIYERLVGPIPEGLVLDHLCEVHRCVNPEHLEPVTNAENVRRAAASRRRRKAS